MKAYVIIDIIWLFIGICRVTADSDVDEFLSKWNDENNPCREYDPPKPNFQVEGRRISEAKCDEYIWEVEKEDENDRRVEECKNRHPGFVGIKGGRETEPGEFPHMGALGWSTKKGNYIFLCGSFLISEEFLVTAAHCSSVADDERVTNPSPKIVRLGVENIIKDKRSPYDVNIIEFITHPSYKSPKKNYDIALILMEKKVMFSKFVRPACLSSSFYLEDVKRANITGWGISEEHSENPSAHLQATEVNIVNWKNCDHKLWNKHSNLWWGLRKHQFCATTTDGTADTCSGDSGGPIQIKKATNTKSPIYNVIGVTSFGFGGLCGKPQFPSIYTKVATFLDWIEDKVWPSKKRSRHWRGNYQWNNKYEPGKDHWNNKYEPGMHHRNNKYEPGKYHRNNRYEPGKNHINNKYEPGKYYRNNKHEAEKDHRNNKYESRNNHRNNKYEQRH